MTTSFFVFNDHFLDVPDRLFRMESDGQVKEYLSTTQVEGAAEFFADGEDSDFLRIEIIARIDDDIVFEVQRDGILSSTEFWRLIDGVKFQQLTSGEALPLTDFTSQAIKFGDVAFGLVAFGEFNQRVFNLAKIDDDGIVTLVDVRPEIEGIQTLNSGASTVLSNFTALGEGAVFTAKTPLADRQLHYLTNLGEVIPYDANPAPNIQPLESEPRSIFAYDSLAYAIGNIHPDGTAYALNEDGSHSVVPFDQFTTSNVTIPSSISNTIQVGDAFAYLANRELVLFDPAYGFSHLENIARDNQQTAFDVKDLVDVSGRTFLVSGTGAGGDYLTELTNDLNFVTTVLGQTIENQDIRIVDELTAVGDIAYFSAQMVRENFFQGPFSEGRELWRLNADNTYDLVDVNPNMEGIQTLYVGNPGSDPEHLTSLNGYLYFIANAEFYGSELWVITPEGNVQPVDFDRTTQEVETFSPGLRGTGFGTLDFFSDVVFNKEGIVFFDKPLFNTGEAIIFSPTSGNDPDGFNNTPFNGELFKVVDGIYAEPLDANGSSPNIDAFSIDIEPSLFGVRFRTGVNIEGEISPFPSVPIVGTSGDDSLTGGADSSSIFGSGGNDTLVGGGGNDTLIGGDDIDHAVFDGSQAGYTLTLSNSGATLADRRADGTGTDRLSEIEFLDFEGAGGTEFALFQQTGIASLNAPDLESFVELYIAYFNRAPDAVGLGFWGTAFANGFSLPEIAELFINQDETRATYPDTLSNEDFATAVYNNVLGRVPDQIGFDFWVGALNSGGVGKDQFILSVLGGAKADPQPDATQGFIDQQLLDRQYLADKTDIGAYFSVHKGMSDVADASAAMAFFDGSAASITAAVNAIDGFYAEAVDPENGEFLLQLVGVLDDPFMIG